MSSQQPILDEAQIREFFSVLAAGLSREAAAGYIDCPLELIQHLARTTPEFEHAMRRVEIDFELSLVARIMQASEKSPHLAKWLLERMRPDQFGRRPPAASRRGQAAKTAPDLPMPSSARSAAPSVSRRGHAAQSAPDPLTPDPLTQDPLTPELFMPDAFLRDLLALLPGSSTAPSATLAGRARDESPRDNDALSVSRRGHAAQFAPDMHATSPGPSAAPCAPLAGLASDEPMATPLGQAAPVGAPSPAATFTEPHPNRWADAPRAPDSSAPRSPDTSVPRAPSAAHTRSADARVTRGPRPPHAAGRAAVHALLALLIGVTTLVCLGLAFGRGKLDIERSMLVRPAQTSTTAQTLPERLDTWTMTRCSRNTRTTPHALGQSTKSGQWRNT
jgi:hypothetical protein